MLYKMFFVVLAAAFRLAIMLIVTASVAGLFSYCFNHLDYLSGDHLINYWQSWALLSMAGIVRFVWNYEEML